MLAGTLHRLEDLGGGDTWDESTWEKLTEEERAAFGPAYARYEEAQREARAGR